MSISDEIKNLVIEKDAEIKDQLETQKLAIDKVSLLASRLATHIDQGGLIAAHGSTAPAAKNAAEVWKDAEGRAVPVLAKAHRMSAHVSSPDYQKISAPELLKALFTGSGNSDIKAALSEGTDNAGGYADW